MRLRVFYSPSYAADGSSTYLRLKVAAQRLQRLAFVDMQEPVPLSMEDLRGLHSDEYLRSFDQGIEPLASSQGISWSVEVRDAVYAMLGGQLAAVEHALHHKIAMNLARGFHHAVPDRGAGYCAINGLALIAKNYPDKKVFVLDCDEHGGNGTEEFAALLPNLYNFSIFGTRFGCRGGTRSWAQQVRVREDGFGFYREALEVAAEKIDMVQPDILLYQSGADSHWRDPKGQSGMRTIELYERDRFVFQIAKSREIPTVFVVAGGYQDANHIAHLNLNTVRAAHFCFSAM